MNMIEHLQRQNEMQARRITALTKQRNRAVAGLRTAIGMLRKHQKPKPALKAFHVWIIDGWSSLVLAESADKAKAMFNREWKYEMSDFDNPWKSLRARREKSFDHLAGDEPKLYDSPTPETEAFWKRFDGDE